MSVWLHTTRFHWPFLWPWAAPWASPSALCPSCFSTASEKVLELSSWVQEPPVSAAIPVTPGLSLFTRMTCRSAEEVRTLRPCVLLPSLLLEPARSSFSSRLLHWHLSHAVRRHPAPHTSQKLIYQVCRPLLWMQTSSFPFSPLASLIPCPKKRRKPGSEEYAMHV